MALKIVQEVTEWNMPGRQPNHVYLIDGDRAYAYVPWGRGKPFYFRTFQRLDRRGRKFVEVKHNPWKFDLRITTEQEPEIVAKPPGETWEVAGSKGAVYTVSLHNGQWSCSCPGYSFRRRCRHVEEQKAAKEKPPGV